MIADDDGGGRQIVALMPTMTGADAVRVMRQDDQLSRTPIFAITALAFESDRLVAIAAGYDRVLTKPFGRRALLEMIAVAFPETTLRPGTNELAIPA